MGLPCRLMTSSPASDTSSSRRPMDARISRTLISFIALPPICVTSFSVQHIAEGVARNDAGLAVPGGLEPCLRLRKDDVKPPTQHSARCGSYLTAPYRPIGRRQSWRQIAGRVLDLCIRTQHRFARCAGRLGRRRSQCPRPRNSSRPAIQRARVRRRRPGSPARSVAARRRRRRHGPLRRYPGGR